MDEGQDLKDLLTKLVDVIRQGQDENRRAIDNLAQQIAANREAVGAVAQLANSQTRAFNILREVVLHLWQDRYPETPFPDTTVN